MKTLIDLFAKFSGAQKLWDTMDGYKTKIAGGAALFSGLAGLLNQLLPLISSRSAGDAWAWAQALPQNQSWQMAVLGLGMLGLRHAIAKQGESSGQGAVDVNAKPKS